MHEVLEGKNLERNLPPLLTELATVNHIYAGLCFTMEYFSFCESVRDGETGLFEEPAGLLGEISRIVGENLTEGFDADRREEAVGLLSGMRERITRKMQVLTTYTDIMTLYEYMLNRMELRYAGTGDIDNDAAAAEILQYIFMEKDNVTINERIHRMLSQLPIRMSRVKFCDIVRSGFEPYFGMELSAAEDFVYRVESAAGLCRPDGFEDAFPEIHKSWQRFRETDWNGLGEKEFQKKQTELSDVSDVLKRQTEQYFSLMGLVNHLYAWLLSLPYSGAEAGERLEALRGVLAKVSGSMQGGGDWLSEEESDAAFRTTEGLIEQYALEVKRGQAFLEELSGEAQRMAQETMLGQQLACVRLSGRLLEDSLFAALEEKNTEKKAERRELNEMADALCAKFLEAFSTQPQLMNRAMIASVFLQLPVFFESRNEVADYVRSSLAGCHDLAEKVQSVRLMKQWMEE